MVFLSLRESEYIRGNLREVEFNFGLDHTKAQA